MESADANLIPFLRNLADSIEKGNLLPKQLQKIGEFFMAYQFQEQSIKDKDLTGENLDHQFSKKELMKFIVMGWHIYSCILKENEIFSDND
jgi:hypothetical protein